LIKDFYFEYFYYIIVENQDLLDDFEKLKTLAASITTYASDQKKLQDNIKSEIAVNLK